MGSKGWEPISEEKMEILSVEDSPENQLLLRLFLKQYPCSVDMASNGEEAVRMYARKKYDIVLMDMVMPVKDGYTATKDIRILEEALGREPAHIIAITAKTQKEHIRKGMMVGCNQFLHKPIDRNNLLELLNHLRSKPVEFISIKEELEDLIPQYIVNRYLDLRQISISLKKGDFTGIELIGHKMKGSGSGYGLNTVSRLGKAIVAAAALKQSVAIAEAALELESFLQQMELAYT